MEAWPAERTKRSRLGHSGIGGIVAQKIVPQLINDRRQPHGRAGMAGVGLLHGVNGKGADGIDAQLI